MIRIFLLDNTWFNVDNETDATYLIDKNAEEFTAEQIINAVGNEHLICNVTMHKNENGDWYFQAQEPTQEELVRQRIDEIKVAVQNVLDAKAQELEYDDGFTLATYATSTKERYRNQANQFIAWRDNVWDKCYEILNAFQSGEIEMPTIEYVLERLPSLNWDDTSE